MPESNQQPAGDPAYGQPAGGPAYGQPPYAQPFPAAPQSLLSKGGLIALIFGIVCLLLGALIGLVLIIFPQPFLRIYGGPPELFGAMRNWLVIAFSLLPIVGRTLLYGALGLILMIKNKSWAGGPFHGTVLAAFGLLGLLVGRFGATIPTMILSRYGSAMIAAYSMLSSALSTTCGTLQLLGSLLIFACCCYAMGRAKRS